MTLPQSENIILDGSLLSQLRTDVEDVFNVESVETPRQAAQGTILFLGSLLMQDSEAAYDIIAERWRTYEYTPMLRHHQGRIALIAQPGVVVPKPSNPWINLGLAIATIVSVWFTGATYECGCIPQTLSHWLGGLPMMLAMMIILLAHEFGHYFAAKYHKVAVTLPYFIPLPIISPVGTMGAFIQLRSPFKTKKQLFDIGVAGPLGGLIFAIPLIFWVIPTSSIHEVIRGPLIVSGSDDGVGRVWDAATGKEITTLDGHTDAINSTSISPNGQNIVTAGNDTTARLWNSRTGEELRRFEGHSDKINSVAFIIRSSNAFATLFGIGTPTIVTAGADNTIRIWDATTGQEINRLEGLTSKINSVSVSIDGLMLATVNSDQVVQLWDTLTGEEIRRIEGHTDTVNSVAFNPSRQNPLFAMLGFSSPTIVTASDDGTARVWNVNNGVELLRLEDHTNEVKLAVPSPDGTTILTVSADQIARLWNSSNGRELFSLDDHTGIITSADFSSDGLVIVTTDDHQNIYLRDASRGNKIAQFEGQADTINSISVENFGSLLEGNSIFYLFVKYLSFNQVIPSYDAYANLPFIQEFFLVLIGDIPNGGGQDIFINSLGFAAWFGLFITALNLLPVGQLDGGHIIYCLIGDRARYLGTVLIALMVAAGIFWWPGWLVWALLTFFVIGPYHPPPLNDLVPIGTGRKVLAYIVIFIFIIMFMPNPLQPL